MSNSLLLLPLLYLMYFLLSPTLVLLLVFYHISSRLLPELIHGYFDYIHWPTWWNTLEAWLYARYMMMEGRVEPL